MLFSKKRPTTTTPQNSTSTQQNGSANTNKSKKVLTLFSLILMNIVAVVSLRGLPSEAEYGIGSIFYYVFAAVMFLIPVALVAAELASTYTERGGVFRWVGEAFGPKLAFLAMFLLWTEVTIWFPTALTFGAVSLAYINPDATQASALANNKYYILAIVLIIYWVATILSSFGLKVFSKVAKWGGIIGTIIPVIILIGFGIAYVASGNQPAIPIRAQDILPRFNGFGSIVLAAGVFLFYAGLEMNAIHVNEMKNPKKQYPIGILIASIVIVVVFILGTLAVTFILPKKDISLTEGLLTTFTRAFAWAGVPWLGPVVGIMLAIGVLAGIVTWVSGPSNGMLVIGEAGYLPRWFQHKNKNNVPTRLLIIQAILVTILSVLFVILPSVQAAYQILSQLTVILYLIMYLLMFAAAIYLRYSQPNRPRPYKIPGPKNIGMWIFGGLGFIGASLALVVSFAPPKQIAVGSPVTYVAILIVATIVFCVIPFIIIRFKKDHWKNPDVPFAPFTWQSEKAEPGLVNESSNKTEDLFAKYYEERNKKDIQEFDNKLEAAFEQMHTHLEKLEKQLNSELEKNAKRFEKDESKLEKKLEEKQAKSESIIKKAEEKLKEINDDKK